ncbi:MAG TPA: glycosyltransferase [Ktedonobacteraceae bacterium]|nr:glycosyltransferase [Ktedonobacteraceae bacterium]
MMKKATSTGVSTAQVMPEQTLLITVCMHVLREARDDVRAMRAASALIRAGATVSMIDIESQQGLPAEEVIDGLHVKHLMMPAQFGAERFERHTLKRSIQLFLRSIQLLLQTRADIYHACEVTALPACYIAARWRRKPLIFEAYECPLKDRPVATMGRARRMLHRLLKLLLAHIVPRCAGVIAVSPPIVEQIKQRYAITNVSLVRNILPYHKVTKSERLRQHLGLGQDVRIALYQGFLQPDRSLDILVRAGAFLAPNTVIVLMGKGVGKTLDDLQALIASEGIGDRVKILPPVPYEQLLDWTSSADLGLIINAYDYSPNICMQLPNKLFEYLMAGVPVLTAQFEAVVEIVTAYGVGKVISSLLPADIGAAINALLAQTDDLEHMRQNALQAASERLSWEKESAELIALYRKVLDASDRKRD